MLENEKTTRLLPADNGGHERGTMTSNGYHHAGTWYSRGLAGLAVLLFAFLAVTASVSSSKLHLLESRIHMLEEENRLQERVMELIHDDIGRLEKQLSSVNQKLADENSFSQNNIAVEEMSLISADAKLRVLEATNCSQPCMGITQPYDWKKWYKTGIYVDVDTTHCDFPSGSRPMYFTSVTGSSDILANDFGGEIFRSKHDSFRTVLHNAIDYNKKVTPSDAMDGEFRVQWMAFLPPPEAMNVSSKQE